MFAALSHTRPAHRLSLAATSLALHGLVLAVILGQRFTPAPEPAPAAASVVIDLQLGAPPQPASPVEDTQTTEVTPKDKTPPQSEPQHMAQTQPAPRPVRLRETAPASAVAAPQVTAKPGPVSPPHRPVPSAAAPAPSAPQSPVAPPATRATSTTAASWQAQILAQLERHRRYPALAQRRKLEGVAHIRIRINRQGRVLSTRLEETSGHSLLDQAALAIPARAQPLPAIPAHMADEVELVVPMEFYLPS